MECTPPKYNGSTRVPSYFLGVDGGQTTTTALIGGADGRVLGEGTGGQSNHASGEEGRTRLIRAVTAAVSGACASAGLPFPETEFEAACLGFTGGPEGKEPVLREVLRAKRWLVTDDPSIALAGAHGAGPGIVTIAGTGSVSLGRNVEGRTARAGGWGYAFGDEGGAWGIVREALRAALRLHEGWGPPTLLLELFLEAGGDSDIHRLRRRFYTTEFPRDRIAGFSALVDEAAGRGDAVAREILLGAAQSLAEITRVVRNRLFDESEPVAVACIGGVFNSPRVKSDFSAEVERLMRAKMVEPLESPARGALREAIRIAGEA